jgi:hypothetical protein
MLALPAPAKVNHFCASPGQRNAGRPMSVDFAGERVVVNRGGWPRQR